MSETNGIARNAGPEPMKAAGGTADGEDVLWLDGTLYDELTAASAAARARVGMAALLGPEKEKLDAFLYWEARLLDSKRYRDWIDLLATDFVYWIPASADAVDPRLQGAVNFDDRRRMIDRVTLIETNIQWSQVPRSRTCRMLSNIEAFPDDNGGMSVRSNLMISEYRNGQTQTYIGWQQHDLIPAAGQWRIRRKFIYLLDCDRPQGNTTFIL
jgi:benzoate/toluate 1,2-dioxygenase subunit beta